MINWKQIVQVALTDGSTKTPIVIICSDLEAIDAAVRLLQNACDNLKTKQFNKVFCFHTALYAIPAKFAVGPQRLRVCILYFCYSVQCELNSNCILYF